ncbi:MAG: ribosome maturation factor RimP, partial [Betaproteobacteria bacterium]|nr:ribosome maturation factor RimP [Betaproteobacteria bacterium]
MQVFEVIERSVLALGYELVDVELAAGTLRVFIDWPAEKQARVTIEDCELVSRQLSQVMMVEAIDYKRLEVS